jgi:myo-inositol-1(or 4)-monophosphatase
MRNIKDILLPLIKEAAGIMIDANLEGSVKEKLGDAANLVTKYDLAVQSFLIEKISEHFAGAYFFAEEKENDKDALLREYCFIIDPIDGTANFVHGVHHSCISVALISRGEAVFGAVYNPYFDEMFYAVLGEGAYLNGKRIYVSERNMAHAMLSFGSAPYNKADLAEPTFALCKKMFGKCSDFRRGGSAALDLAYVAAGRYDMFFEYRLSPWDFAAGALLIKEAGGIVTDMTGAPLSLGAPGSVMAATPTVYDEFLSEIKSVSAG